MNILRKELTQRLFVMTIWKVFHFMGLMLPKSATD